jgi:hypothetical protein
MRAQYRVGALMQAVATASAALFRGGTSRAPRATTLRMAQVDTGGLGAPDICVLGGGFGGLYTALRLSKLDWGDAPRPRVTLVDRQERFVFLPMLYEVATGSASCWEVTLAHCRAARPLNRDLTLALTLTLTLALSLTPTPSPTRTPSPSRSRLPSPSSTPSSSPSTPNLARSRRPSPRCSRAAASSSCEARSQGWTLSQGWCA